MLRYADERPHPRLFLPRERVEDATPEPSIYPRGNV